MPGQARPVPTGALLCLAAGLYLVAGFVYVATVSDWPPFWPPMDAATRIVEALATNEMAAIGIVMLLGGLFALLGPALVVLGLWRIRAWRRASRPQADARHA